MERIQVEISIKTARPSDLHDLAGIDRLCTQGKGLVYHYERDDFFARSRVYDKWNIFFARAGDTLVGMAAACIKKVHIACKNVFAGYVYDLRVHPSWRGQGISYKLLEQVEEYLKNEGVEYAYTYVLGVNARAKKVSKTMSMHYTGEYRVLLYPCFRKPDPGVELITGHELYNVLPEIESGLAHYDLREIVPVSLRYKEPFPGSPFLGTFRLSGSSGTTAGVWDSSVLSAKVVDRVPVLLQVVNNIPDWFKKRFKLPSIPGQGGKLVILHLIDIRQKNDNPGELVCMVREMQGFAGNRGAHLLMIHLDIKDPLFMTLKKRAVLSIKGHILMRTPVAGELPPELNSIYLDVRDF
ncbi:MAG: GNAT family N-acetyltransferase [Spirochaetales bacterium]|nr:GNAT family N-acetyltransferase [Spirochaetales bacterium]